MAGQKTKSFLSPPTVAPVVALLVLAAPAAAQLRIVTYNTNTFGTEGDVPGLPSNFRTVREEADIVFEAIGEELVNGVQRPADIILLQEQQQTDTTTQNLVNRLNAIYAGTGIQYARGFEVGRTTGSSGFGTPNSNEIRQGVVYRTDSVRLIDEASFGSISGANQPRETLLHQFRPVGFGPEADLFIFNSHFEAGDGLGFGSDLFARENEATDIRNFISANGLGSSNVIVAGDLNVDSNFETSGVSTFGGRSALQILSDGTDAGGRVLDPLFLPNPVTGVVPDVDFQIFSPGVPNTQAGVSLARFLTQSPSDGAGPLVGGGIDDRFDFLLQSDELLDGEGVASIPGTLRAFGNNGSTGNDQINDGNTIQIQGLTSFSTAQVLDALEAASDHLPVVQDFQLPAVLEAFVESVPETVVQGEQVVVDLTVLNASPVDVAIGADELDFTFSTSGGLFGSGGGIDSALGGVATRTIGLDTSAIGPQAGLITVAATSEGAANPLVTIPVSFEVIAAGLPGDFNNDDVVSAADFTVARDGAGPGGVSADFEAFALNFGSNANAPAAASLLVPEPATTLLLLLGGAGLVSRRRPG